MEYTALEKIRVSRPVDRVPYIVKLTKGSKVFDLGALDETAYQLKGHTEFWLHKQICSVAINVIGVDNSKLIPDDGLRFFPNGLIIRGNIFELTPIIKSHGWPDVIVAGELIEHLYDAMTFLSNIKRDVQLHETQFVLTTPNACSWHNIILGIFSRESTHADHVNIYSYKTLNTLLTRAGFQEWDIIPYKARFTEMIQNSRGLKRFVTVAFQKAVNALEYLFPLLSCGWICRIRI